MSYKSQFKKSGTFSATLADSTLTLTQSQIKSYSDYAKVHFDYSAATTAKELTVPLRDVVGEFGQEISFVLFATANSAVMKVQYEKGRTASVTGGGNTLTFKYVGQWILSEYNVAPTITEA